MKFLVVPMLAFLVACACQGASLAQAGLAPDAGGARANALSPRAALARLLATPQIAPDWLAPDFAAQIPAFKLERYVAQYKAQLGAFVRVIGSGRNGEYLAVFAKGTLPALIALDERGRISELLFRVPQLYSLATALQAFRALPGSASYVIRANDKEIAHYAQGAPLEAPSGRALALVDAAAAKIARGRARWDDVVRLDPTWKRPPTAILGDWPAGSPLTLQTLATLAIADRDPTAANALAQALGRDALAPYAAENGAAAAGATWQYTNRQLCDLLARVQRLAPMSVNPGLAVSADWDRVAYAGGSNAGAVAMTTWLVKGANSYCVSATWNPDTSGLDASTFDDDYFVLLNALRER